MAIILFLVGLGNPWVARPLFRSFCRSFNKDSQRVRLFMNIISHKRQSDLHANHVKFSTRNALFSFSSPSKTYTRERQSDEWENEAEREKEKKTGSSDQGNLSKTLETWLTAHYRWFTTKKYHSQIIILNPTSIFSNRNPKAGSKTTSIFALA